MPRDFPPESLRGSRTMRKSSDTARDQRVRHQPFDGVHEERQKESKMKTMRQHIIAMIGEFAGTFMFLWFSFAIAQTSSATGTVAGTPAAVTLTSLGFGFSLLVNVWAFYRISGGLFNPAVTLAMVITGNLPWFRGLLLLPMQLLGAIVAAALVKVMIPIPLAINTELSNGTTPAQGVFIEMFLTALLVFTILMLAAEKHYATFMAPVGIGLALFVAMMAGVHWTGASLNPARSFGPAVAQPHFPGSHWVYWVGPLLGGLLAAGYYQFCKFFKYEEANPGQDAIDEKEKDKESEGAQAPEHPPRG
ncbi:aquaporin rerated protein [Exophiala viscosa]|uniref:Aquaporin rerated protein n=1 Tax=Exophiala viscosa TaxID=2486360 RepID=A0AAN6DSZ6_9EURO|nr:aquaporin rerated protein [Exophiala viscosa]